MYQELGEMAFLRLLQVQAQKASHQRAQSAGLGVLDSLTCRKASIPVESQRGSALCCELLKGPSVPRPGPCPPQLPGPARPGMALEGVVGPRTLGALLTSCGQTVIVFNNEKQILKIKKTKKKEKQILKFGKHREK